MTLPLVSVALATYNGAAHLDEQLRSLRRQTYAPLEIVACDDGSTDGTLAILRRHAAEDARLKVFPTDGTNRGFNGNFARAFSLCTGSLVAPSDQDDVWEPNKLALLVPLLDDPGTAIAYADSAFIDEHGQALEGRMNGTRVRAGDLDDPRRLAFMNCVSGHAMVFRKSLLAAASPFPARGYFDWWLAFVALSRGERVRYLDQALVHYRQHVHAVTHKVEHARNTPAFRDGKRLGLSRQQDWLEIMATHPSPHQPFFVELERAFAGWRDGVTGLALAAFVGRHAEVLHSLAVERRTPWGWARKYVAGYRAKRLTNPRRYPPLGARDAPAS